MTEDARHQRNHRVRRKVMLNTFKQGPCVDCGGHFPPECMDFDHVRGVKKGNVSQLLSMNLEDLMDEVMKCDVVCANCHRTRTHDRLKNKGGGYY